MTDLGGGGGSSKYHSWSPGGGGGLVSCHVVNNFFLRTPRFYYPVNKTCPVTPVTPLSITFPSGLIVVTSSLKIFDLINSFLFLLYSDFISFPANVMKIIMKRNGMADSSQ